MERRYTTFLSNGDFHFSVCNGNMTDGAGLDD